jgi:hypothetical protein
VKIILLTLLSFFALAEDNLMDRKKGFVIGTGLNLAVYSFPVEFEGQTKNQIDDKATIIGPHLQLGYDVVLWSRILLGVRAEGLLADTAGMGSKKNSKISLQTKGQSQALNTNIRLGFVRDFQASSPVGDSFPMIFEIFAETGVGSGRNNFIMDYTYSASGVNEAYKEKIRETFRSRILSAGFNLTSKGGSFFELKVMKISLLNNTKEYSRNYTVNGGGPVVISDKVKNTDPEGFTTFLLTVGHHY